MNPRDTIAEMMGVEKDWFTKAHPIPNDLNFISRARPDGWEEFRCPDGPYCLSHWEASSDKYGTDAMIWSHDTGDELADRMALLAKMLEWLRDNDRPAFDAAIAKARRVMEEMRP